MEFEEMFKTKQAVITAPKSYKEIINQNLG